MEITSRHIVRGSKNPFIVVGHDSCTSGRYKCTPKGPTRFQRGDRTICTSYGDGRLTVHDAQDPTYQEDWEFGEVWTGV